MEEYFNTYNIIIEISKNYRKDNEEAVQWLKMICYVIPGMMFL